MNERTKKTKDDKIRYRKIGGGSMKLVKGDGKPGYRIIKPSQVFRAHPDEIPEGFRDLVQPLDEEPITPEPTPKPSKYVLKRRGNSNWYDVVDEAGKKISEKALQRQQALDFITKLEG